MTSSFYTVIDTHARPNGETFDTLYERDVTDDDLTEVARFLLTEEFGETVRVYWCSPRQGSCDDVTEDAVRKAIQLWAEDNAENACAYPFPACFMIVRDDPWEARDEARRDYITEMEERGDYVREVSSIELSGRY